MLIFFDKELEPFILDLSGVEMDPFGPPWYLEKSHKAAWFDSDDKKEVEKSLEPALLVFGLRASFVDLGGCKGLTCFLEERG